jgi:hypothetical protein
MITLLTIALTSVSTAKDVTDSRNVPAANVEAVARVYLHLAT